LTKDHLGKVAIPIPACKLSACRCRVVSRLVARLYRLPCAREKNYFRIPVNRTTEFEAGKQPGFC